MVRSETVTKKGLLGNASRHAASIWNLFPTVKMLQDAAIIGARHAEATTGHRSKPTEQKAKKVVPVGTLL